MADLSRQRLVVCVREAPPWEGTAPRAVRSRWLSGITEHKTGEGTLYLCAINDVFSNRIVGYSISDRMKARLAVDAVANAVARRGNVAGCVLYTDR